MYQSYSKSPLPTDATLQAIRLRAIVRAVQPDREKALKAGLRPHEYERLLKAWREFEGPIKDAEHFAVCVEIDDEFYATATYNHGSVEVAGLEEEEIDPELVRDLPFAGRRVREKRVGPNEPCPCGSAKKFKKCCGR